LPRKIAIEQYFTLQTMHPHRRAQSLVDVVDRIERESRSAAAKENRRNDHMQAIETAGLQEPRKRVCAALDEHAAQSHPGKSGEDIRRLDMTAARRQRENIDVAERATRPAGCHDDAAHAVIGEQAGGRRKTASRIDDNARRSWPGDMANRQLRIISDRAANTDDHGVDQRAKPMQMRQAGRAVDIARMSGPGRGASIKRLTDLANDDEVVDRPYAQWPEHIFKGRRHCFGQTPKYFGNHPPRRGGILDFGDKGLRQARGWKMHAIQWTTPFAVFSKSNIPGKSCGGPVDGARRSKCIAQPSSGKAIEHFQSIIYSLLCKTLHFVRQ
jgi:hypothetical protein